MGHGQRDLVPLTFRIAVVCCLAIAVASAQTQSMSVVDEKLRQADDLQAKGNLHEAQQIYESVLRRLQGGPLSAQLGHTFNGLSTIAESEGNYKHAVEFAQHAYESYRGLGNAEGQSYALNNRAIAQGELGLYSDSQESFRQALVLSRSISDFETEVRTLNNLGNAYYFPGMYREALQAYEDAWRELEKHESGTWSDYWRQITKINEATLYQRLGRYQSALHIYQRIQTSKGLSASDRAHLLTNLGALYRRLGDPQKALTSYQAALDLYSQQHDSDGEISVLKNIGIVYALDQDKLVPAQRFFERSLSLSEKSHNLREKMQSHLYLGETFLRKGVHDDSKNQFSLALAEARQLGTPEEQWKALYGIGRVEELSRHAPEAEAEYREAIAVIETTRFQLQLSALRAEFLADKRDVYDALIALLLEKNDLREAFLFLERSRARTFQDRLTTTAARGEGSAISFPTLEEIMSLLDPSTTLMEFWASGDKVALIWCTRDRYGVNQFRFSKAEQEDAINFARGLPGNLGIDWRKKTSIFSRLIPPDLPVSSSSHHLVIVPDDWLSSVPFDLVPYGNSGTALIERFDISYLPTAALLRRRAAARAVHFPWSTELSAFGDPVVPANTFENPEGSVGSPVLPYSKQEIENIASMAAGKTSEHLGDADLKSRFLAAPSRQAPILHVSTHAYVDTDVPESSRMLFSPETSSGPAEYLFLRELYDLDLSAVDMAVLSACNTDRGKLVRGEGVQAFSRALLFAGSRSALTTMWRVADQPTSEFMKQFYYFALVKRQSRAEAMRSAKLKFLNSNSQLANPAHWAGFVLNGDGMSGLPYFISWGALATSGAVIVLALGVAVWLGLGLRRRVHRLDRPKSVVAQ